MFLEPTYHCPASLPDFEYPPATLVDMLRLRARHQPGKLAYTFLRDGETEEAAFTYAALDEKARTIAAHLQALGLEGERALLLYPSGLDYIAAFFGCLYAGVIAIPAYPPRKNRLSGRIEAILDDAQARVILTTAHLAADLEKKFDGHAGFGVTLCIASDALGEVCPSGWKAPRIDGDSLAFLQYTSGSTGSPKGVMVTHANLLYNLRDMHAVYAYDRDSVVVSWLPIFHDMGLVQGILLPVYSGSPCYFMAPVAFLEKPVRWLRAIAKYRGTHNAAPNFAYELCAGKVSEAEAAGLDLSCWKVAINGSEPVRAEVIERFNRTFAPSGLSPATVNPGFGLAEATLKVTANRPEGGMVVFEADGEALEKNRVRRGESGRTVRRLVGCGFPILDTRVVIAHPDTLYPCGRGEVGEIWVGGPTVAKGYWNKPAETERTFGARLSGSGEGPFMRTGDLGFVRDNQLFVTGRLKDLIIIRGTNHYPQDLECTTAAAHPALRPGAGAAFSVEVGGEEKLFVAQEVERTALRDLNVDEVVRQVREAVMREHDLPLAGLLLLRTGTLPKTSSGKIQRQACKKAHLANELSLVGAWTARPPEVPVASAVVVSEATASVAGESACGSCQSCGSCRDKTLAGQESKRKADDVIHWLQGYAASRLNSQLMDERRSMPPYVVLDLGNRGVLGMQVPKEYGGLGLNHAGFMRVMEQAGAIDQTLASFLGVNNILGIRPVLHHATAELREEMLPVLAAGRELAAFAITEPGAGSNPRNITARAIPIGKKSWFLKGTKIWSGNAAWAGLINVFVKDAGDHHANGITGFAVRQGSMGLSHGPEALTMGMRGMVQNAVYLNNVPVNESVMLGKRGAGMDVAQDTMMYARLGIAAIAVGAMKRSAQLMLRYAENRTISTGKLLDNAVTLSRMTEMALSITACEVLVARVAALLDGGVAVPGDVYSACKIAAPEFLHKATDHLVQLLGGRGYLENNLAPQMLRDARLLRIFEGPTETLQMFLGSRVIHSPGELLGFIAGTLGARNVAARLQEAALEISKKYTGDYLLLADRNTTVQHSYYLTGELATYAILWAVLEEAGQFDKSDHLAKATHWAKLHFETARQKALSGSPAEIILYQSRLISEIVSGYADTIGDVEQSLAGEEYGLDPLLRREPAGLESYSDGTALPGPLPGTASVKIPIRTGPAAIPPAPPRRGAAHIQEWLFDWLKKTLDAPGAEVNPELSFTEWGLDSVTSVVLAKELRDWLQVPVSETIVWNYPNVRALARFLAEELTRKKFAPEAEPVFPGGAGPEVESHLEGAHAHARTVYGEGPGGRSVEEAARLLREQLELINKHIL